LRDTAIKKDVADYQKASGNTIELSIMPFAPQRQKIVAAVQSGIVPDVFRNTSPTRRRPLLRCGGRKALSRKR